MRCALVSTSGANFLREEPKAVVREQLCYDETLRLGIHTSRSGALEKAALKAAELGANTFQIFSASPRMWRALPPTAADIRPFRKARERFDLRPLVIHANYLINLASLDPVIREKSIAAFRGELERADMIGAEYLVIHPGHCKDCSREHGMAAFVLGLAEASRGLRLKKTMLLLENTVGQGSQLGSRFDELRAMRDLGQRNSELRIGYCLDTCHLLASGFDIARSEGLDATVAEVDAVLGLANVKVIHTNDSKKPLGSRVDRHANIGEGHIGLEGFRRILAHPRLHNKPFILETPVDQKGDDLRNMETLKNLCPKSSTATARSN